MKFVAFYKNSFEMVCGSEYVIGCIVDKGVDYGCGLTSEIVLGSDDDGELLLVYQDGVVDISQFFYLNKYSSVFNQSVSMNFCVCRKDNDGNLVDLTDSDIEFINIKLKESGYDSL